jgi:hypothetical protein
MAGTICNQHSDAILQLKLSHDMALTSLQETFQLQKDAELRDCKLSSAGYITAKKISCYVDFCKFNMEKYKHL